MDMMKHMVNASTKLLQSYNSMPSTIAKKRFIVVRRCDRLQSNTFSGLGAALGAELEPLDISSALGAELLVPGGTSTHTRLLAGIQGRVVRGLAGGRA